MSLKNAILGILNFSPMNGYHLSKIFDESVNYAWNASLSQIYRDLNTLEIKGYVYSKIKEQDDKPNKKIYMITEAGKKSFNDWLRDFPDSFLSPKRDEFMLRIFFASELEKEEVIRQLKRFIKEREDFNNLMSKSKKKFVEFREEISDSEAKKDKMYLKLIAKRAKMSNQTLIEWAKYCIEELDESDL